MDRYTKERIDMITGMIMVITNMQENDVKDLIGTTVVYRNIIKGEECTLYEDYSANLMSIVKELRKKNIESGICEITSDKVSDLNQQIFSLGIRNADQLKKNYIEVKMRRLKWWQTYRMSMHSMSPTFIHPIEKNWHFCKYGIRE